MNIYDEARRRTLASATRVVENPPEHAATAPTLNPAKRHMGRKKYHPENYDRRRAWYERHREREMERNHSNYYKNRDKILARMRAEYRFKIETEVLVCTKEVELGFEYAV